MNLQSRGKRWLAAVDVASVVTKRTLTSEAEFRSRGRPYPDQAHDAMIKGFFALRLTAEADPIRPESPLYGVITAALTALDGLKIGPEFRGSLEAFDAALEKALDVLREYTADDDSNIDEIISSLERAFMVSLLITLTSHTFVVDWDGKWQQHHQRFVNGNVAPDFGHYIEIKSGFLPCEEPGPGRVHAQHIHSALVEGTTVWIAAGGKEDVDYYPEFKSIIYSQWFAYMHAIWDEQYRGRIAKFFDTPEERIRKRDVINDLFGDIRLIRNDYVHNKGIADEAVNTRLLKWGFEKGKPLDVTTEQLLSLIDLFPRDELKMKPVPQPAGNRTPVPGSISPDVLDDVLEKLRKLGMDKNAAIDEAFTIWLASKSEA